MSLKNVLRKKLFPLKNENVMVIDSFNLGQWGRYATNRRRWVFLSKFNAVMFVSKNDINLQAFVYTFSVLSLYRVKNKTSLLNIIERITAIRINMNICIGIQGSFNLLTFFNIMVLFFSYCLYIHLIMCVKILLNYTFRYWSSSMYAFREILGLSVELLCQFFNFCSFKALDLLKVTTALYRMRSSTRCTWPQRLPDYTTMV